MSQSWGSERSPEEEEERRGWKTEVEGEDGGKEERTKREIVTTELVAGADFFHHLPCEAPEDKQVGGSGESES